MLVCPLGEDMHINKKPLSGGTFPTALEGGIQVLLPVVATQRLPNPREDSLVVLGWTVEVLERTGIKSNLESAFTQHGKTAECSDDIQIQVDQFTLEEV
jgi:hypothetical protein